MKQTNLQRVVFFGFVLVKALGLVRTGMDTWAASHDVVNVLLIDGLFAAMWIAAAYGGRGENALAMRPFAAAGAWLVYISMVVIGWEVHHDATAFAARIAIGVALSYDTWDMIVAAAQRMRFKRKSDTFEAFQARIDRKAKRKAYEAAMNRHKANEMQTAMNMIVQRRIEGYAQAHLSSLPDGTPSNGYTLLDDGKVKCMDCGWTSTSTYASIEKAQPAYAGHTRSAAHRAVVAQALRIDVTPND